MLTINRGTKAPKRVHTVNQANAYSSPDIWESARVWGCGNPATSGSTAGDRIILQRRNVSKFTVAGTARI
jgi:hypothetical protein